jgi:uncharacterized protein (TIGR02145 family)/uncharacterized repeat protein (TIGR02543 family)
VATANPTSYTIESAAITLNNPTRTGYTFAGWTGSNGTTAQATVTIPAGSTGNKSYTATWTEIPVIGDGKGTFTDSRGGGTTYKYVTIGGKKWMAENLNYDTADGTGSWCYGNKPDSCVKYGRLYNWNTAMAGSTSSTANPSGRRGVCPEGWHLPSRAEWGELAKAAGGTGDYGASGTAGKALKSTSGWYNNGNGTDSLGFSALPGGYYSGGSFNYAGYDGIWWTATEYGSSSAYLRDMYYYGDGVYEYDGGKGSGYSVRCVGGD